MADYTGKIEYDTTKTGNARLDFNVTPLPVKLKPDDTLTISIGDSFPENPTIDDNYQITNSNFWDADGDGNKGTHSKGSWTLVGQNTALPDGLNIEAVTGGGVKFTDTIPTAREDYYFDMTVVNATNRASFTADPELVVKKKTTGP